MGCNGMGTEGGEKGFREYWPVEGRLGEKGFYGGEAEEEVVMCATRLGVIGSLDCDGHILHSKQSHLRATPLLRG